MGKNLRDNNFFILSGLNLSDNNRGTAALGYGAFSFLEEKGYINKKQELLQIKFTKRFWKNQDSKSEVVVNGRSWRINTVYFFSLYRRLCFSFGIIIPFSKLWRYMNKVEFVAAINGGDGFSDIYNTQLFKSRLSDTLIAMAAHVPVIQLPQTLGPFSEGNNYNLALKILRYSRMIFVRDDKFSQELTQNGLKFELTKDLSAFMKPEPWDINIAPNSVGINISGLAYSNSFRTLSGQFEYYPILIDRIIRLFQGKGLTVYLIPHSYNYRTPENSNDDMVVSREAYERLSNKSNVILVDRDLTSPQVKYVISQMSFFCGTRMHANFAAIYTKVPVFGLAYSYKFEGAFNSNGLNGSKQTVMINNITKDDVGNIVNKIDDFYNSIMEGKHI